MNSDSLNSYLRWTAKWPNCSEHFGPVTVLSLVSLPYYTLTPRRQTPPPHSRNQVDIKKQTFLKKKFSISISWAVGAEFPKAPLLQF
ncbi:hypothetical protein CDAR_52681 [Caerostris darwini]|uniref:Uncharacterized protein n=1 Tax=Caerostris darwini TaxID=1538125 RepID=A0AAV4SZW7_9ARAC|nr:hypothetical protein CDAR_52681 [Caerostris darwini]